MTTHNNCALLAETLKENTTGQGVNGCYYLKEF